MKKTDKALKIICYGAILVMLYSIMTYGISTIHSDTATATMLAKCQINNKQFIPDSWCYVNGEFWTLGVNLFVLPFCKIVKNQALLRMLATVLALATSCCIMQYFFKKVFNSHAWVIAIPFCFVYVHGMTGGDAIGEFINSAADCILYEGVYVLSIAWILLSCAWMIKLNECRKRKKVLYSGYILILLVLLCMGSIRFLAEISCAIIGTEMIIFFIENKNVDSIKKCSGELKKLVYRVGLITISSGIGLFIYMRLSKQKLLGAGVSTFMRFPNDALQCWDNFVNGMLSIFVDFGYVASTELFSIQGIENMICLLCAILLVFVFPFLQILKFKEEKRTVQYFIVFTCVHNLIIILMMVWCGYTTGRYLITSIYLCLVMSARYIGEYFIKRNDFRTFVFTMGMAVVTAAMCGRILVSGIGWIESYNTNKELVKGLEEHGLYKGYASYWNSYKYDVYSDFELNINALVIEQNKIEIFPWLVDYENYQTSNEPTFLMLNSYENGINGEYLQGWFGDPIEVFELQGYVVYVYDYDIIQNIDESSDIIFN